MPFKAVPYTTDAERDAWQKEIETTMAAKAKRLDFTNVKDRMFNIKHLPEGDYPARVKQVDDAKSKKTGAAMWLFTIEVTGGGPGTKGASFPYYCTLTSEQLWKVRNLFSAAGLNIPKKMMNLDPNKVVGRPLGVTLEDDEYEGKLKSVIAACIPLSDIQPNDDEDEDDEESGGDELEEDTEDEEDEEEAPPPPKKPKADKAAKKPKPKPAPAADEDDDDELEELEIEEL